MAGTSGYAGICCLVLIISAIVAGCSEHQEPVPAPLPSVTTAPRYGAGDIVAKTESDAAQQLYIITRYDSGSDRYTHAWIYRNSDGSWGHFVDSRTYESSREVIENAYPYRAARVAIASIPVITPAAAAPPEVIYAGPAPVLVNISPGRGIPGGTVTVTIAGKNFQEGATVRLLRPGSGTIAGTATTVSPTTITTAFDLGQHEQGNYNVIVANPDGRSDTLVSAFTIGG
jgi:hypothetical protein